MVSVPSPGKDYIGWDLTLANAFVVTPLMKPKREQTPDIKSPIYSVGALYPYPVSV